MKLVIAVVAAMSLGACATTENGGGGATTRAAATGAKQYCREGSLGSAGGKHNCTWSTDKAAACENYTFSSIDASRYTSPRTSSQCANGRWLVEMSPIG